jgi:hypothetical protein
MFGPTGSVQGDSDETCLASVVPRGLECPGRGLGAVLDDALDVTFASLLVFGAPDVALAFIVVFDAVVR